LIRFVPKYMTKEELQSIVDALPKCLGTWIKLGPGDQNGKWSRCPKIATVYAEADYFCDEHKPINPAWELEDLPYADAVRNIQK
jgi:hypothetical protein